MEALSSFYPNLSTTNNLKPRVFGCISYVHIHNTDRGKLDPRALKCVFVGYSLTQKGYKCYHPPSKNSLCLGMLPSMNKRAISINLIFRGRVSGKIRKVVILVFPFFQT
ncbi:hypothetical protein VIGAN_05273900 [Vigna angularis var. angularis]|uniref:Retroviral polymerase SH3-like domain-containing protein n=1 Tax=Vigna angularis var. angularis TaxID=157739 RepID=A0A0S3S878_PHAAN|nr:hypothetical protein VIGAN_05273900 [Vigna angularis var. angularis]